MNSVYAVVGIVIGAIILILFADNATASASTGMSFGTCGGCSPTGQTSNQNGEPCDIYNCAGGSVCVGTVTGTPYGC